MARCHGQRCDSSPEMWLTGTRCAEVWQYCLPELNMYKVCVGVVVHLSCWVVIKQVGVPRCDSSPQMRLTDTRCDKVWQFTWDVINRYKVRQGVTVHLRCVDNLQPRRYVIVQLPHTEYLNFSELEVYVRRMLLYKLTAANNTPYNDLEGHLRSSTMAPFSSYIHHVYHRQRSSTALL